MYWQESEDQRAVSVPDDVVDIVFHIRCRALPVDHAHALMSALQTALPWLKEEGDQVGVHPIHVADSGNGWMRPERPDDLLYPSRRTRLVLRAPKQRIEAIGELAGKELDLQGHTMTVADFTVRPLSSHSTIFSRYIAMNEEQNEQDFLAKVTTELDKCGICPKKMLCGIEKKLQTPSGAIRTRSLMLADMTQEESIQLQQQGLGSWRQLGCGLFIPHKDIQEVRVSQG